MRYFFIAQVSLLLLCVDSGHTGPLGNDETLLPLTPLNDSVFIDVSSMRKPDIVLEKESDRKSLADFQDFLQNTRNVYFAIWLIRIAQVNMLDVNKKEEQIIINPLRWWKNFMGFQNDGRRRGDFEWKDGDRVQTNWVAHPAFGAYTYLYYRAKGYDRFTSALGSVVQSTLFEYTIEGMIQSPSIHDLIITPGIGVPVGIVLEETSNLLASSNSGFLNALGYIVNPMKIIVPDQENVNLSPLMSGQVVIGFQW